MLDRTRISRRTYLGGVAAIASGVGGCLSFRGADRASGDVVVENESGGDRTVTVTASRVREEATTPDFDLERVEPPDSHIWQRVEAFEVPDGETNASAELIPKPGTYHISAASDRGGATAIVFGFYPVGRDGESPGGGVVYVSIDERNHTTPRCR